MHRVHLIKKHKSDLIGLIKTFKLDSLHPVVKPSIKIKSVVIAKKLKGLK